MPRKQSLRAASKRRATLGFPAQLAGMWSALPRAISQLHAQLASVNWHELADNTKLDQRETKRVGNVAVIPIIGTITKYAGMWDRFCGTVSSSWLIAELEKAEADSSIAQIVLLIDSPGGMTSGSFELAMCVLRCTKPVVAVVSDTCCSAAYLVAAQADHIVANPTADIGSIGVVAIGLDDSEFWESHGFKWKAVASSSAKAAGHDHVIDEELEAEWQRGVDDTYEQFIQAVAFGRDMSIDEVRRIADGRVHRAAEAFELGLIDEVVTDPSAALQAVQQEATMPVKKNRAAAALAAVGALAASTLSAKSKASEVEDDEEDMEDDEEETASKSSKKKSKAKATDDAGDDEKSAVLPAGGGKAATVQELEAEFPGDANAKFVLAQLRSGATLSAAREEHRKALVTENARLRAEFDQLKQQVANADPGSAGLTEALKTAPKKEAADVGGDLLSKSVEQAHGLKK
jgi:capsid assembly protease